MRHEVIVKKEQQLIASHAFPRITTLLIGRNIILLAGLRHILSNTPFAPVDHVVDPASDVSAFVAGEPVLILLCDGLSPEEYLQAIERLKGQCPSAWVVVLADHLEPYSVLRLFQAGLNGLCSLAMGGRSLVKALELVVEGETFFPAQIGLALLEQQSCWCEPDAQERPTVPAIGFGGRLSGREAQILRCLMQGASNKMIARQLDLAEATVKVHLKSILKKVKADNRTQAAMWAQQHLLMEARRPG